MVGARSTHTRDESSYFSEEKVHLEILYVKGDNINMDPKEIGCGDVN
jgi:hypothetical protein